ncbi:hypothetical protein LBBP_02728 [Leptospira borgpetersenii serovar Ballum]|uniref:Uncharacterized protein n=1 Tax=Leptospira borgpetersenii serovar Ballum TaxID=280505 RepID=A0A0S2ITG9_LEPBO|nr:hypothetical protein LBBP_02728 [Leptospira borgpetersenii serovar Ballum]
MQFLGFKPNNLQNQITFRIKPISKSYNVLRRIFKKLFIWNTKGKNKSFQRTGAKT